MPRLDVSVFYKSYYGRDGEWRIFEKNDQSVAGRDLPIHKIFSPLFPVPTLEMTQLV